MQSSDGATATPSTSQQSLVTFVCSKCGKEFSRKYNRNRHEKTHDKDDLHCGQCKYIAKSSQDLNTHKSLKHVKKKNFKCGYCDSTFATMLKLQQHTHTEDEMLKSPNSQLNDAQFGDDESLKELVRRKRHIMGDQIVLLPHQTTVNFLLKDEGIDNICNVLDEAFAKITRVSKMNVSFGYILSNNETGEYRYYYSSDNTTVLPKPKLVENFEHFKLLKQDIFSTDFIENFTNFRDSTKWTFFCLTNVSLHATHLSRLPMGSTDQDVIDIPDFIKSARSVWTLTQSRSTKRKFNDNLCVFRALAAFQQNSMHGLESKTMELFQKYIRGVQKNVQDFAGIELTDLPDVEKFCSCAIRVFSAELDVNKVIQSELLYRSKTLEMNMQSNFVDLLLVDNHTCLIRNLNVFFRRFKCIKCEQYFSRLFELNRHLKSCSEKSDHFYPGGKYTPTDTFFTTLETVFDVCVPHEHRFYKFFVTFDFESILRQKSSSQQQTNGFDINQDDCFIKTKKLEFTHQHIPVSVAIYQNITTEESAAKWLVEKDPNVLVEEFVDYLMDLSLKNISHQRQKFLPYLEQIDEMLLEFEPDDTTMGENIHSDDEEAALNETTTATTTVSSTQQRLHRFLKRTRTQFLQNIDQLPIVGFNSGFYGLNLIKSYLLKSLQRFVSFSSIKCIKRNTRFLLLSTPNLRFMDCSHFVAAGTSLDKFLKAYGSEVSKFFFPYEHLTSFEILQETSLPPYEAFVSSLKNENVLENEINSFVRNGGSLTDPSRPKTGLEVYADIKQTWDHEGFQTMMDYLQYYNNLDVYPLHKAVTKMARFYEQHSIDLLKETLTLSGAANKILHRSNKGEGLFLFNYKHKDLYQSVRNNIVGGSSIVFSCYEKIIETAINDEIVKSIVGYDANALYLSAIGGNMPTGPLTHYVCNSDNALVSEKSKFLQTERQ